MILDSILPILVVYKQNLRNSISLNALSIHLDKTGIRLDLFVYDNSPALSELASFKFKQFDITYIHDPLNSGVSKAYNTGAKFGSTKNKEWIMLLDQDTSFPDDFMIKYQEASIKNPEIKLFCPILITQFGQIMSPCVYRHKQGQWVKQLNKGVYSLYSFSPVNSGMMINLKAFNQVGGYNESVRLDFADFQFIERFKNSFKMFCVIDLVCRQEFSGFEKNIVTLKNRFVLFCEGARNCDRCIFSDNIWYLFAVLRRLIGLTLKTKKISFIPIFIRVYLLKK